MKDAAWPRSDIDRFLLAALEAKGLKPVADADRPTLLRRVTFDLIGLPPTPEEVEAFVADESPGAFEKVVDRLLASPPFGERWGRHWLDVARYAESSGKQVNFNYPHAWRYRDYVIDGFNADKPYDRFVEEQLAGDLLPARTTGSGPSRRSPPASSRSARRRTTSGTRLQFELDVVDEQIDVTTQAFLGLTVACARCHDHKFDPIPQRDYYALAGIFRSTETLLRHHPGDPEQSPHDRAAGAAGRGEPAGDQPAAVARRPGRPGAADRGAAGTTAGDRPRRAAGDPGERRVPPPAGPDPPARGPAGEPVERRRDAEAAARWASATAASRPTARSTPAASSDKPGEAVPRGLLQVLAAERPADRGRAAAGCELADWLASTENPLTARVMVNRVWLHLFGRGLVPTPDNFGASRPAAEPPELLDTWPSSSWTTAGRSRG